MKEKLLNILQTNIQIDYPGTENVVGYDEAAEEILKLIETYEKKKKQ